VFGAPNFVRFVTCPTQNVLKEAILRIQQFCIRHSKPALSN
jgi:hypothetical protein